MSKDHPLSPNHAQPPPIHPGSTNPTLTKQLFQRIAVLEDLVHTHTEELASLKQHLLNKELGPERYGLYKTQKPRGCLLPHTVFEFTHESKDWQDRPDYIEVGNSSRWAHLVNANYDGDIQAFLKALFQCFKSLWNSIHENIFNTIIDYCEPMDDFGNIRLVEKYRDQSIITRLFATSRARNDCEFACDVLRVGTHPHVKWFTNNYAKPMIVFEFAVPVIVYRYLIQSANDCPHRDPQKFYLFGCNDIERARISQESVTVLHSFDRVDGARSLWNGGERWHCEEFLVRHKVLKKREKFRYVGLHVLASRRDQSEMQIGSIRFECFV